jgi:ABC-type dipeptide/oligopeptide/nickel transport system ATPase subunit
MFDDSDEEGFSLFPVAIPGSRKKNTPSSNRSRRKALPSSSDPSYSKKNKKVFSINAAAAAAEQAGSDSDDSEVEKEDKVTCLIIGKSGSGKSTLTKHLAKRFASKYNRPVYVVNQKGSGKSDFRRIGWDDVDKISKCALIVDDIINLTKPQMQKIVSILNDHWHHRRVNPVMLVFHTSNNTGAHSLIGCVNRIYISAVQTSYPSLKDVLNTLCFDEDEKEEVISRLKSCKLPPFSHFCINVETRRVEVIDLSPEMLAEKRQTDAKKEGEMKQVCKLGTELFSVLLKTDEEKDKANIILGVLVARLDRIDPVDLSVIVKPPASAAATNKKGGSASSIGGFSVNIVDYICCLLNKSFESVLPQRKRKNLALFHIYLKREKRIVLPSLLITNDTFV